MRMQEAGVFGVFHFLETLCKETGIGYIYRGSIGWDHEELFGTVGRSMFTLMQVMTLDSWLSKAQCVHQLVHARMREYTKSGDAEQS